MADDFVMMPIPRALVSLVYETIAKAQAQGGSGGGSGLSLTFEQKVRRAWDGATGDFKSIVNMLMQMGPMTPAALYAKTFNPALVSVNAFNGILGGHERLVRELGGFRLVEPGRNESGEPVYFIPEAILLELDQVKREELGAEFARRPQAPARTSGRKPVTSADR